MNQTSCSLEVGMQDIYCDCDCWEDIINVL